MCIKHYYISKTISRPRSAELDSKTVFLWKNWKKSIFVQFWGTIKNEVFPTSKPHKMTKNDCFIKKKIPPRYYAYINPPKKFSEWSDVWKCWAKKKHAWPPPYRHVLESGSLFDIWQVRIFFVASDKFCYNLFRTIW